MSIEIEIEFQKQFRLSEFQKQFRLIIFIGRKSKFP